MNDSLSIWLKPIESLAWLYNEQSILYKIIEQIIDKNERIIQKIPHLCDEFVYSNAPLVYSLCLIVIIVCSYLLYYHKASKKLLILVATLACSLIILPMYLPFKALRFFAGLYFFATAMTIISKTINILQKNDISADKKDSILGEFLSNSLYSIRSKLNYHRSRNINVSRVCYWLFLLISIDGYMFLIKEWIPVNLLKSNQYHATAILIGLWVLASMQWNYTNMLVILDANGWPLPSKFCHRHPLLSTSVSEFWSLRWNPIIGKLLQETFYLPFKKLNIDRFWCIIWCFLGSSLLHCIPQYLSTYNISDFIMMGIFFILHGAIVIFENIVCYLLGLTDYMKEKLSKRSHHKYVVEVVAEIIIIAFVLCFYYLIVEYENIKEKKLEIGNNSVEIYEALTSLCVVLFSLSITLIQIIHNHESGYSFKNILFVFIGFIWTLSITILLLPLFAIPLFHAVDTLWTQSFVVGPIVQYLPVKSSK